jgi:hypothetical protein
VERVWIVHPHRISFLGHIALDIPDHLVFIQDLKVLHVRLGHLQPALAIATTACFFTCATAAFTFAVPK